MRPQGDVRTSLREAAKRLRDEQRRAATWRDLAITAQVGFAAAKHTVKNMARAGELKPAGRDTSRSNRGMTLYLPAEPASTQAPTIDNVMRAWSR